jgi:hypothetical protein
MPVIKNYISGWNESVGADKRYVVEHAASKEKRGCF